MPMELAVVGVVGASCGEGASGPNAGAKTTVVNCVVSSDVLTATDTAAKLVWHRDGSGPRFGCGGDEHGQPGGNGTCTWAEARAYCGVTFSLTFEVVNLDLFRPAGDVVSLAPVPGAIRHGGATKVPATYQAETAKA